MKTTQEYFNLNSDELLEIGNGKGGFTREECLLFDDGLEIVFFDDEKELAEEKEEFEEYMNSKKYTIKEVVKTINERLAVILV